MGGVLLLCDGFFWTSLVLTLASYPSPRGTHRPIGAVVALSLMYGAPSSILLYVMWPVLFTTTANVVVVAISGIVAFLLAVTVIETYRVVHRHRITITYGRPRSLLLCDHCGTKLTLDSRFCDQCGVKLW